MSKKSKKTEPKEQPTRRQVIDAAIEDAMRPYLGVLPPSGLKTMRDILEDALTTHHVAVEAIDELVGGKAPGQSGTREKHEAPDDGEGEGA
jgi:hypothetical protein